MHGFLFTPVITKYVLACPQKLFLDGKQLNTLKNCSEPKLCSFLTSSQGKNFNQINEKPMIIVQRLLNDKIQQLFSN